LIREVCDTAKARGKPVQLLLLRNNPALSLYQRLGFKIIGREGHKLHMSWDAT
jgi:ribosomal protein S18 acetylase RimI-like enzyme